MNLLVFLRIWPRLTAWAGFPVLIVMNLTFFHVVSVGAFMGQEPSEESETSSLSLGTRLVN
jgi:hypothetical protein